jgi:starvation-inducible DNA-binding protein
MNKININGLLNQYVADTAVMFIKLHNIHWNVIGPEFLSIHKYTEELYNHFFKSYDEFAEILKVKSSTVFGSMQDYLKVATIKELGVESLTDREALKIIADDFAMLLITVQHLRNLAHSDNDITCTLLAEEEVSFLEKQLWFIKTMLK